MSIFGIKKPPRVTKKRWQRFMRSFGSKLPRKQRSALKGIFLPHLDEKGRGRALRKVWLESNADIVSYMDVDLSTSLYAFPELIKAIISGYDIAFGSRLVKGSRTYRSFKREFLSRIYSIFLKITLWVHFRDAQCGFKAVSRRIAQKIVPRIKNGEWFFDTELLVIGEKLGYKLAEIPVEWKEEQFKGRVSTVKMIPYIIENFIGTIRLLLTKKSWLRTFSEKE